MDIIDKLKKGKSVFDALIKKKETKEEKVEEIEKRQSDVEIREVNSDKKTTPVPEQEEIKPISEFSAEGMHELDVESLSATSGESIKGEYRSKIIKSIDAGKIDEAINLLAELKNKLEEKNKQSED
jgi:hypothetical protein